MLADFAYKIFYLLAGIGAVTAILSFFYGSFLKSVNEDNNKKMELAADSALSELSMISGDKRYVGTESRLIVRIKGGTEEGYCSYYSLCKTNQGNWFTLNFVVARSGGVVNLKLTPLAEFQAKHELSPYPDLYTQEFGIPEIA